MTDRSLTVGLCQYGLSGPMDLGTLLERADGLIEPVGAADCYVLPELFAVDTTPRAGETIRDSALTPEGFDRLAAWCGDRAAERDAVVVGGSAYVAADDLVNRAPIGLPDGSVRTYDKRCPIPSERAGGVVGGGGEPPLVETDDAAIGVLICYDVEFPVQVRRLVDRGAEVLVVPSWTGGPGGYERVRRCTAARAVENQVYAVQVSLVGEHPSPAVGGGEGRSGVFAPCDDVMGPYGTRVTLPRNEVDAGRYTVDLGALDRSRAEASVRPYSDSREFPDA